MSRLGTYTAADLGLTGPVLHARPGTDRTFDVIVTDIVDWSWERRWDGKRLVEYLYRSPGLIGEQVGLCLLEDLVVTP